MRKKKKWINLIVNLAAISVTYTDLVLMPIQSKTQFVKWIKLDTIKLTISLKNKAYLTRSGLFDTILKNA